MKDLKVDIPHVGSSIVVDDEEFGFHSRGETGDRVCGRMEFAHVIICDTSYKFNELHLQASSIREAPRS